MSALHEASPFVRYTRTKEYLYRMFWNPKNRANNELGEYLPDDNAQLQEASEYLEASSPSLN